MIAESAVSASNMPKLAIGHDPQPSTSTYDRYHPLIHLNITLLNYFTVYVAEYRLCIKMFQTKIAYLHNTNCSNCSRQISVNGENFLQNTLVSRDSRNFTSAHTYHSSSMGHGIIGSLKSAVPKN
jgi:hypothetical protein